MGGREVTGRQNCFFLRVAELQSDRSGQITGISLKAINSSKRILKIAGPTLSNISSVLISARTLVSGHRPETEKMNQGFPKGGFCGGGEISIIGVGAHTGCNN